MKLACSSSAFATAFSAGRLDLREWLRLCADEMDLDGVELAYEHVAGAEPDYLREVKRLCLDHQLTIAGTVVHNDFGPEATRTQEIANVQRACDIAAVLGAPTVSVCGSSVPGQARERDAGRIVGIIRRVFGERAPNTRALWSDQSYALRQCADSAAERGVALVVHNSRAHELLSDVWQIERCLHDTGARWLRAGLDPAGLADRRGMDHVLAQTVHVRARLRDVREDGSERAIAWAEVLGVLWLGRYRGFVTLDYDGDERAEAALPRAARFFRGALHLLERQRVLPSPSTNGARDATVIEATKPAPAPVTLSPH